MLGFYFIITLAVQALGAVGSTEAIPEPDVTCTAVTPAPTGCGIKGNVLYNSQEEYPIGSPQIVDSVEECASYCERRFYSKEYWNYFGYYDYAYEPYCTSFMYSTNTSLCQLGRLDVTQYVEPSAKSKSVYYNTGCYDCGPVCKQPYGDQLIDNGGFEDSLLGPWQSTKGSLSKGYQSSKAYHCAEDYSSDCFLSQEVNMCKNQFYAVQFDYLTVYENKSRKAPTLMLGFGGYYYFGRDGSGAFTYNAVSENTDPNAWKTVRGYFEYIDAEHSGPYFRFGGGGASSIDNVYVSRVPAKPDLVPSAKNLLKNGGFETGDLTSWKTSHYQYGDYPLVNPPFKVVSPGIKSKYGVSFTSTDQYANQASMYLSQTVTTKPNTTYLVNFDIQIPNKPFEINLFVGPKSELRKHVRRWDPGNYTFSVPVVATSSKTLVQFQVDDESRDFGMALMDNFKMMEIVKSAAFP